MGLAISRPLDATARCTRSIIDRESIAKVESGSVRAERRFRIEASNEIATWLSLYAER